MSTKSKKNFQKYYVVWEGRKRGIFDSWVECKKQVEGFNNAKFQSFKKKEVAEIAFQNDYKNWIIQTTPSIPTTIKEALCVDGAYSSSKKTLEYQAVFIPSGRIIFKKGPFTGGSNNIAEFLALVHALVWCKKKYPKLVIYSDSRTAMSWVRNKRTKTNIQENNKTKNTLKMVKNAVTLLKTEHFSNRILKWDTEKWGENPADFGRK